MSCVFQNIDPHPPLSPASVQCVPPPMVRGEDTLAGWRGGRWVNILEDARHSSALYLYRILFKLSYRPASTLNKSEITTIGTSHQRLNVRDACQCGRKLRPVQYQQTTHNRRSIQNLQTKVHVLVPAKLLYGLKFSFLTNKSMKSKLPLFLSVCHRVYTVQGQNRKYGEYTCPLSWSVHVLYTTTLKVTVDIVKADLRAPLTLTRLGCFFP